MTSYYICSVCCEPVKTTDFQQHCKKHGKKCAKTLSVNFKQIFDTAYGLWNRDTKPLSMYFIIARLVISKLEGVDTSNWSYVFDYEYPEFIAHAKPTTKIHSAPTMCVIKFAIKDAAIFEELIERSKGTEKEKVLKEMVTTTTPTVMVYYEEWKRLRAQEWKNDDTQTLFMTVYMFLHEMYHILGYGEWDAGRKSTIAMYRVFSLLVGIPEQELERWKTDKREQDKRPIAY